MIQPKRLNPELEYDMAYECPYCGKGLQEEWPACCGEFGHAEWHFISENPDGDQVYVCPKTGKVFDEPCEESRVS